MDNETWKDVIGFEDIYKVSNKGRVKSLKRDIKRWNDAKGDYDKYPVKEKILSISYDSKGYEKVYLSKNGDGRPYSVHRLVLEAFIPNKYGKNEVNHKNGIKDDNRLENLEWATSSENTMHAYKNGLMNPPSGKDHWNYGGDWVVEKKSLSSAG